jgi:hypothetical protein
VAYNIDEQRWRTVPLVSAEQRSLIEHAMKHAQGITGCYSSRGKRGPRPRTSLRSCRHRALHSQRPSAHLRNLAAPSGRCARSHRAGNGPCRHAHGRRARLRPASDRRPRAPSRRCDRSNHPQHRCTNRLQHRCNRQRAIRWIHGTQRTRRTTPKHKNPGKRRGCSAQRQNRTADTRIFNPLLYRLSYLGECGWGPPRRRTMTFWRAGVKVCWVAWSVCGCCDVDPSDVVLVAILRAGMGASGRLLDGWAQ